MKMYGAGAFAREVGVTIRTLQRWDTEGKLVAFRTPGNHRRYTEAQLSQALQGVPEEKEGSAWETEVWCGDVLFEDRGACLRLQIEEQMPWALWNEAHVQAAILMLQQWLDRKKREKEGGAEVGTNNPATGSMAGLEG